MAFTEAQRAKIRLYLGWPDRFHQTDSRLEQAMNAIDTRPDTQTLIEAELARLATIDTALDGARSRMKALKVGPVELPAGSEMAQLRSQGRQASGRIASLLGVDVRRDVWVGSAGSDGNLLMVC